MMNLKPLAFNSSFITPHSAFLTQRRPPQPVAAVDDDDRAVDEAGGVGAEEDGALFDVAYAAETAEGDFAAQALLHLFGYEARHAFGVFDGARRDGVDAYALRAPLDREVARERVHARLRRRYMKLVRRAEVMQRRADVENLAAILLQLLERRAADVKGALEVDVDDRAEAVRRKLRRGAQEVPGRAVDDDVYAPELLNRRGDGALYLREVAHVRRVRH